MRKARWFTTLLVFIGFAAPASADVDVLRPLGEDTRDSHPGSFVALPDETVLFAADDAVHGRELWRTDGTAAGTAMVADLTPGPTGSAPRELTVVDGIAYFTAGATGFWRSDGTAAGTQRFLTLPYAERRVSFAAFGDEVVIGVELSSGEFRFMATDGTAAGTRTLDFLPGGAPAPRYWHVAGGSLYFDYDSSLWRTDGTRAGTTLIEGARGIEGLISVGGHLVASVGGALMTVAPGATEATFLAESSGVRQSLEGRLYFATVRGMETWAPGETATIVHDVAPVEVSPGSDGREEIARSGGRLFWAGANPARLYTPAGRIGAHIVDPIGFLSLGDGRVLFSARDDRLDSPMRALWVSDGTEAGTRRITETHPFWPSRPLARTANGVVGPGALPATGIELHRTDATLEGSGLLVDINRRTVGSDPSDAARVGDRVVFKTNEQQALWVTDGTHDGTVRLLERDGDGLPLDPMGIASDGTNALFAARDGIYRTDGTADGTAAIADIGVVPESFTALARVGSTSVFTARGVGEIPEASDLWRTDGTAAGTQRLTTGALLSFPEVALGGAGTMLVSGYGGIWATDGSTSRRLFPRRIWASEAVAVDDGFLVSSDDLWHLDANGQNPRVVRGVRSRRSCRARSAEPATGCCSSPDPNGRRWTWRRSGSTR